MTALHKAYYLENLETFKLLLKRGADPDLKDEQGDSPRELVEGDKNGFFEAI